jgi:uncharacterized protein YbjQ (UPF0145 family)
MTIVGVAMAAALPAQARNVKHMLSIQSALESEAAKAKLDGSVKLYFGPQVYGKAVPTASALNAHGRMPIEYRAELASCFASFADALHTLQKNAKDTGANAVVNIVSYFKNGPVVSSATEFECHAGSVYSHVMLKGELVKIDAK